MSEAAAIDVAVGVVEGKVVARWREPMTEIAFDPHNAYTVGEALARAAHEAHYGAAPSAAMDRSFIADQIKARITDQIRDAMIMKVASILQSKIERRDSPGRIALRVVDAVLADIT